MSIPRQITLLTDGLLPIDWLIPRMCYRLSRLRYCGYHLSTGVRPGMLAHAGMGQGWPQALLPG